MNNHSGMEAEIRFVQNTAVSIAIAAVIGLPEAAVADHVPDNLSQDLDPNYIACLMAVDDAEMEFRDALQSTCIGRMGDICSGRDGTAPVAEVIDCHHFETQRGIGFLQAAAIDLPETVEKVGFFGIGYERRRTGILQDIKKLRNAPKPQSVEAAIQQSVTMASTATILFWLARETGTQMDAHLGASFVEH